MIDSMELLANLFNTCHYNKNKHVFVWFSGLRGHAEKKHEAAEKFTILHLTLYGELWLEVVRRLLVRAF